MPDVSAASPADVLLRALSEAFAQLDMARARIAELIADREEVTDAPA